MLAKYPKNTDFIGWARKTPSAGVVGKGLKRKRAEHRGSARFTDIKSSD